uniref:Uncharacterized protein n=1 Tax=Pithovirus LCPAC403 TaxID=2506596 RepID=A0A481ZC83_9VIRU|nr:MAG: hypothetical protein LCPAC403_00860 [Pithovirus LCPAC403]
MDLTGSKFSYVPKDLVKSGISEKQLDGSTWYTLQIYCEDSATEAKYLEELSQKIIIGSISIHTGVGEESFLIVRLCPDALTEIPNDREF